MAQPNFFHDMFRTQLLMQFGSTAGLSPLKNMILLNLYERAVAAYPTWFPVLKGFCCRRKKVPPATAPPPSNKEIKSMIQCERIMTSTANKTLPPTGSHVRMDAVVNYVTTIPAIRNLICMTQHDYLPNEFEPVQIEPDLYFQLTDLKHNDGQVESIRFKLFCYDHEVQFLQAFVDRCNADYERRMKNKLGTNLYFFDMMTDSKNKNSTQNRLPTTHLIYTKHKFYTTRSFDNVFFEQRSKVKKHVEFFLTRKDWYEKKGIPYTLGFMFHGDPGCGKCLGKDTPVMMADGTIKMVQDIVIGDQIMGDDSAPRNVLSLARGRENLYKVIPVKGDPYIVNESHILSLKVSKKIRGKVNGEVIDIPVKEFLEFPDGYLKGYKVGVTFPEKEVPIDPYLLGYWLGDGCSTKSQITTADPEVVEYFKESLESVDVEIVKGSDKYGWNIRSKQFDCHDSPSSNKSCNTFLEFLKQYNLLGNKHIPNLYKYNSRDIQLSILAGVIDSDGHVYRNCCDIILVNEKLLDDVIYIARSLGFAAYKKVCEKTCTNGKNGPVTGTYYRTIIHGEGMEQIPTIIKRKELDSRKQVKDALVTGIRLECLGEGEYYGFEIDGNRRFLLGDFTVTHNTSTVKAIANTARRHIINVQLSEIKSKAQLRHLFFNEEIHVYDGTTTERYTIPVHERIYVIEDIDAMGDAVLRREWKKPTPSVKEEKKTGDPWMDREKDEDQKEPIDLSFLLNLLDGTLESSGRILAISSNFPERIDRALIRPGRIDMIIHFKKCNRQILQEMVNSFYDSQLPDWTTDELEYKWSPAEVNQILFRNFDKPQDAIQELINLQPKDLYGFETIENGLTSTQEVSLMTTNA
jgi:hypothetical protein